MFPLDPQAQVISRLYCVCILLYPAVIMPFVSTQCNATNASKCNTMRPNHSRHKKQLYCSCSNIGNTSNSLLMILSNSSLSIPDAFARRNKLLISVLMCCLIAISAWL
jgi:hypothetical protein